VGRDEERGRTVELLHRGPAHPAPFLAGTRHQLSHVRDDHCVLGRRCTLRVAVPGVDWAVIFPLAVVAGSHILLPIIRQVPLGTDTPLVSKTHHFRSRFSPPPQHRKLEF
jgi:hypothetical protein